MTKKTKMSNMVKRFPSLNESVIIIFRKLRNGGWFDEEIHMVCSHVFIVGTSCCLRRGSEGASGEGGDGAESIVFGTGGTSGSYYPIGGALKPVLEESELISNVTVESTGASRLTFRISRTA